MLILFGRRERRCLLRSFHHVSEEPLQAVQVLGELDRGLNLNKDEKRRWGKNISNEIIVYVLRIKGIIIIGEIVNNW